VSVDDSLIKLQSTLEVEGYGLITHQHQRDVQIKVTDLVAIVSNETLLDYIMKNGPQYSQQEVNNNRMEA
jgi:hypothetical protein